MADGSVLAAGGLPDAPITRMMGGGGVDNTVLAPLVGGLNPTITEMKGGAIIQVFGRPVEVRDTIVMPLTDAENEILATWSFTPDMGTGALPVDDQKIAFLEALKISCTKDVDINDAKCKPIRASLEQLAKSQLERLSPGAELVHDSGKISVDVNGLIKIEFTTIAAPPAAITPVAGTGTGGCPADSTCIKNAPFVEGAAFTNVISRIVASTDPAADINANIADFTGGFLKVGNTPSFADSATAIHTAFPNNPIEYINIYLLSKMMEINALLTVDISIKENIQNQFTKFIRLFAQNDFLQKANDTSLEIFNYIMNVPAPAAAAPTAAPAAIPPLPLPKIFSVIEGQQQKIDEFIDAIIIYRPGKFDDDITTDIFNYLSDASVAWDLSTDAKIYAFMRLLNPGLPDPATGAFAPPAPPAPAAASGAAALPAAPASGAAALAGAPSSRAAALAGAPSSRAINILQATPAPVRRQIAPLSEVTEAAQQAVQEQGGGSRRQVKKRKLRATQRKSKQ